MPSIDPISPPAPLVLDGFAEWSRRYDVVLCDIWGVLHDGRVAHPGAADALTRYRERGGTVVLVSNAPRPGPSVAGMLDEFRIPRTTWDGIVTSGDVTRSLLEEHRDRPYYWLGPARDAGLFEGLGVRQVALEEAELVVCTGLFHDERETPDDYRDLLDQARARKLPMICANPDLIVERGDELVYCAGAVAELYAELGGEVIMAGKPFPAIYAAAIAVAEAIRRSVVEPGHIVAIGDALRTDIAGAVQLGCASLFVARGIHTRDLGLAENKVAVADLHRLLSGQPLVPTASIDKLVW
jgi:HAD superfamily hydrolase (TIGR01459 family)